MNDSAPPSDLPQRSLRQRAIFSIGWIILQRGLGQPIRFISNLILIRLLTPEWFGLSALVHSLLFGVELVRDIGIRFAVIQNEREDAAFLNTAWLMQIAWSVVLWGLCCLSIAPLTIQFYNEPLLGSLLFGMNLTLLISGFNSTKILSAERKLTIGRLTIMELIGQVVQSGLLVMVAISRPTIWAVVAGVLSSAGVQLVLSHVWLEGRRNTWQWDRTAFRQILPSIGWIFGLSCLTLAEIQLGRWLLGGFLSRQQLNVYTVAVGFSTTITVTTQLVQSRILFPAYAEIVRDRPTQLSDAVRKSRLFVISFVGIPCVLLSLGAPTFIPLLFDTGYGTAGWMIQIVAIMSLVRLVGETYDEILLAQGRLALTFLFALLHRGGVILAALFGILLVQFGRFGIVGFFVSYLLIQGGAYAVKAVYFQRRSLWQPQIDLPFLGAALLLTVYVFLYVLLPMLSFKGAMG